MGNCTATPSEDQLLQSSSTTTAPISDSNVDHLSDGGLLDIPQTFPSWFPTRNAHKNVRQRFEWHDEIGRGVTGSIHSVTYQQKSCALKMIERDNHSMESMFITEIDILSDLHHEGIIGFIDVFLDESHYYLAMERADYDLSHILTSSGPYDEQQTKAITFSLFSALAYLHSKDVVHRDLKPGNIIFYKNDPFTPKIIDFGDAQRTQRNTIYTEFGTFCVKTFCVNLFCVYLFCVLI